MYELNCLVRFQFIRDIYVRRFRRQLVKLIDFCLQMADGDINNDEKQLIELQLVSLIHRLALRRLSIDDKYMCLSRSYDIVQVACRIPIRTSRFSKHSLSMRLNIINNR
jgi:hypothetical protein